MTDEQIDRLIAAAEDELDEDFSDWCIGDMRDIARAFVKVIRAMPDDADDENEEDDQ